MSSETRSHDPVTAPKHYLIGGVEPIEAIVAWGLGFCDGGAVKYIVRAKHKGNELEDLRKAREMLRRHIEFRERELGVAG